MTTPGQGLSDSAGQRGNPTPTPESTANIHKVDDVDTSPLAHHHTLGYSPSQAAPGNHVHTGEYSSIPNHNTNHELGGVDEVLLAQTQVINLASDLGNKYSATNKPPANNVTFTPVGTLAATDVQAALAELDTEKSATGHSHGSTPHDHDADYVNEVDHTLAVHTGLGLSATHAHPYSLDTHDHDSDYEALGHTHTESEITDIGAHTHPTDDNQTAAQVAFTPGGGLSSTDVQAALIELDTEKAAAHTHPYAATVHAHDADYVNEIDHTKAQHTALGLAEAYSVVGTVANSAVVAETVIASHVIAANTLVANMILKLRLNGQVSSTGTLIFRIRIGPLGTIVDPIMVTFATSAAGVANAVSQLVAYIRCITTGAGGTITAVGQGQLANGIVGPATAAFAAAAVNTTIANTLTVTVQQSIIQTYTTRFSFIKKEI